ncbi:MAG: nuclear transport factor 2 family protein [Acidimicrobiales bacterium]
MSAVEARLDRLESIEDIRRIPQRYARAIDERDIDALATLFHPNGEIVAGGRRQTVVDHLAELRDKPRTFAKSMHVLADPLIDVDVGNDAATMDVYAVVIQLERVDGGADMALGVQYRHRLGRDAGGWLIVHRTSEILWIK